MAAANVIAHLPKSFFPTDNGGYAAAVFWFVFLYFIVSGTGPISVDAKLRRG
jgi:putative oxidoreductase